MSDTVRLNRTSDNSCLSVTAYARVQAQGVQLAWAEPVPDFCPDGKPRRIPDFVPLVQGQPTWPDSVPLAEARLFWSDGRTLHIVANEVGGCRWSRVEESAEGETECQRSEKPVVSLLDFDRFGIGGCPVRALKMNAIEYRQDGRLVAWRLVLAEERGNA